MWVPWRKKSSTHTHTNIKSSSFSFDDHPPLSPIHHQHSPSLKDIETLFNHPSPFTPLHKYSLSTPARSPTHQSVSFKDIESLLYDETQTRTRTNSIFHRVKTWATRHQAQPNPPPDSDNKVVVYFTSLHVIRRTYEDCRAVRSILKGYRVKMDERDLSMDGKYVDELQRIMPSVKKENWGLPRVYVNGKYLGGVEEIKRLHENGELKRLIQGLPLADGGVCVNCGGFRFYVCEWCDGSHRVFVDKIGEFKNCKVCNVNGLIQCNFCTSVVF
ncbi:uncharacterized protein At5g39865-like [Amaranthus tricolor]|uniref:uncharacterized protein At5g39865-like n=1 Tax=Amaranthus tricolor TaxID=29722 RepID=UPI00258D893D|nr:uncharacterized protein At5g39865-like [Amaranthus tricolor]